MSHNEPSILGCFAPGFSPRAQEETAVLASQVKALLPPEGKSHALRRRDGKPRPLHGPGPIRLRKGTFLTMHVLWSTASCRGTAPAAVPLGVELLEVKSESYMGCRGTGRHAPAGRTGEESSRSEEHCPPICACEQVFPETSPGVPEPPVYRPRDLSSAAHAAV